jgi:NADP-dependent 3-hydroxy acid dehydrogenase YdfG
VTELTVSDLDAMLRVNVVGALLMMQAVLPVMHAAQRGTIINVASLAGRRWITPLGGYCATKFARLGATLHCPAAVTTLTLMGVPAA